MATPPPASAIGIHTSSMPQGAGAASAPTSAPARSAQREGGNSLGTFGVNPFLNPVSSF